MNDSQTRPVWVRNLTDFLADGIMDDSYAEDGSDDPLLEEIEASVLVILCTKYGHEIVFDQRLIPEHRYCIHCGRRETAILS